MSNNEDPLGTSFWNQDNKPNTINPFDLAKKKKKEKENEFNPFGSAFFGELKDTENTTTTQFDFGHGNNTISICRFFLFIYEPFRNFKSQIG